MSRHIAGLNTTRRPKYLVSLPLLLIYMMQRLDLDQETLEQISFTFENTAGLTTKNLGERQ
jgi:hypothetical protein